MLIHNYVLLRAISQVRQSVDIIYRQHLAGIYFEPRLGLATASDGVRLMTGKVSEAEDAEPFVWIPGSALPTWSGVAVLNGSVLTAGKKLVSGDMSIPAAHYPDYRKVTPADTEGSKLSINPALLIDVHKALGATGVNMQWRGENSAIRASFRSVGDHEYSFFLMPMRD